MTVYEIINTIFSKWGEAVCQKVGTNYFMENSTTVAKLPAATLYFQGLPTSASDLEGNESSVMPTVQVDIYTKGQRALTEAYSIDELSHSALVGMRFRRSYGPELIQSTNPSIKRLTSRYSRVVGYGDKFTE